VFVCGALVVGCLVVVTDLVNWTREPAQVQRAGSAVNENVRQVAALLAPNVPPAVEGQYEVKHGCSTIAVLGLSPIRTIRLSGDRDTELAAVGKPLLRPHGHEAEPVLVAGLLGEAIQPPLASNPEGFEGTAVHKHESR
jgi:hypothetical protein